MSPAGYDLLNAWHVQDTVPSAFYIHRVHSSTPGSKYSHFPFLDKDRFREGQSLFRAHMSSQW